MIIENWHCQPKKSSNGHHRPSCCWSSLAYFPAVFSIFVTLIFVMKHNWQMQMQNHESQLGNLVLLLILLTMIIIILITMTTTMRPTWGTRSPWPSRAFSSSPSPPPSPSSLTGSPRTVVIAQSWIGGVVKKCPTGGGRGGLTIIFYHHLRQTLKCGDLFWIIILDPMIKKAISSASS